MTEDYGIEDYGYCISWWYIVDQVRKRYHIAPTDRDPRAMCEIERMLNEIWYEYPGYKETHEVSK